MERLVRNRSGFTLLIAAYGDSAYRDRVARYLVEGWLGGTMVDARDAQGEFHRLEDAIAAAALHGAVQVIGLERWDSGVESLWQGFNYHRERLASLCRVPLLLWVPHGAVRLVAVEAPDLWAWRSGVFDLGNLPSAPAPETPHSVVDRGSSDATEREARIKEITEYLERLQSVSHPADLALLVERGELFRDLGKTGAALSDFEAAVSGYQEADDRLGEAGAMSHVAGITALAGDPDSSLRTLVDQVLPVYERLGEVRSKAVTWGKIADVYYSRGDLDESLRIRTEEQLPVYERLGDIDGIAASSWAIAKADLARDDPDSAVPLMLTAYRLLERTGRADGLAIVGETLGACLASAGESERGSEILRRSRECYEKLGRLSDAERVTLLIAGTEN
jgi:tetratricopeptide (TPR) repeat protein